MTEQEWRDNVYLGRLDRMERDGVGDEGSGPLAFAVGLVSLGVVVFGIVQIAGMFS